MSSNIHFPENKQIHAFLKNDSRTKDLFLKNGANATALNNLALQVINQFANQNMHRDLISDMVAYSFFNAIDDLKDQYTLKEMGTISLNLTHALEDLADGKPFSLEKK